MTSQGIARSQRRRSARVMPEAERLFAEEDWSLCVRRCQEAVELALKALLRAAGAEVPKVYDVSGALRRNVDRLPPAAAAEIDMLVSTSRRLREERELASTATRKPGPRPKRSTRALTPSRRWPSLAKSPPWSG